jgi:hypothetical protein
MEQRSALLVRRRRAGQNWRVIISHPLGLNESRATPARDSVPKDGAPDIILRDREKCMVGGCTDAPPLILHRKQTTPSRSMNAWMHMLDYFRVPFPSRQGFSAYRFPGLAAHVPFFIVFSLLGLLLCGAGPLLVVWMAAGLYLGRAGLAARDLDCDVRSDQRGKACGAVWPATPRSRDPADASGAAGSGGRGAQRRK